MAFESSLRLRTPAHGRDRDRVLAFVQARFLEHYGAEVPDDSPALTGAFDANGELVAAFGMRDAGCGFFCEGYLDEPLETPMSRYFRRPVERHEVVEITHLCALRPGCLRQLVRLVPGDLIVRGYRYLACTATACLATYFNRLGVPSVMLGEASARALSRADQQRWGAYYQAGPRVMAGDLHQAAAVLGLPLPAAGA